MEQKKILEACDVACGTISGWEIQYRVDSFESLMQNIEDINDTLKDLREDECWDIKRDNEALEFDCLADAYFSEINLLVGINNKINDLSDSIS